jgi:hypothetical protein
MDSGEGSHILRGCALPLGAWTSSSYVASPFPQKFLGHLHLICPSAQLWLTNPAGIVCRDRHSTLLPDSQLFLTTRSFPASLSRYSFPSIVLRTLFLSCRSFPNSNPLFSTVCRLFSQNTGGMGTCASAVHKSQATNHESRRFCWPFVFMVLQIAFPASPFLSQSSALPPGVTPLNIYFRSSRTQR